MNTYIEKTTDHGTEKNVYASDNYATYILTSSYAKDMYTAYMRKYNRYPLSKWYNSHFNFERIK